MTVLKSVGSIDLCEESGKFFLIREHEFTSQGFNSIHEAWETFKACHVRWKKIGK